MSGSVCFASTLNVVVRERVERLFERGHPVRRAAGIERASRGAARIPFAPRLQLRELSENDDSAIDRKTPAVRSAVASCERTTRPSRVMCASVSIASAPDAQRASANDSRVFSGSSKLAPRWA